MAVKRAVLEGDERWHLARGTVEIGSGVRISLESAWMDRPRAIASRYANEIDRLRGFVRRDEEGHPSLVVEPGRR